MTNDEAPDDGGRTAAAPHLIEEWRPGHPRWSELVHVIHAEHQAVSEAHETYFAQFHHKHLVAIAEARIAGFLQFFIQPIGPDRQCPTLALDGQELVEAKILGFAVRPAFRRRGIGRALQTASIRRARALGCFQLRSYSSNSADHADNYRLKLAMGFAVQPEYRGPDDNGVNFIMPLRPRLSGETLIE